ncbi:MAG: hypothetical protein R3D00_10245 [Bacteroidia bacterium]
MKVINEIIDYLLGRRMLNQDDLAFLKAKGFYVTSQRDGDYGEYGEYYGYSGYCNCGRILFFGYDCIYCSLYFNIDETIIYEVEIENELADSRRRKQGKFGYFNGAKKRYTANKKAELVLSAGEKKPDLNNIWWNAPKNIQPDSEELNSQLECEIRDFLKNQDRKLEAYYTRIFDHLGYGTSPHFPEYWDTVVSILGWSRFLKCSEGLLQIFEVKDHTSDCVMSIKPNAFYELLNTKVVINKEKWSLGLMLNDGYYLSITNEFGEKDLRKSKL